MLNFFPVLFTAGPCLLILDGAKCHINFSSFKQAEKYDIQLFFLPSNTTHELQPFDKTVFRPFEMYWDEELLNYWSRFPEREMTKARFGHVLKPTWERAVTPKNITSGFQACGIYPFNPSIIPDVAFAPSEVTLHADPNEPVPSQPDCNESVPRKPDLDKRVDHQLNISVTEKANNEPVLVNKKSNELVLENQEVNETTKKLETPTSSGISTFSLLSTPKLSRKRKVTRKGINVRAIHLTEEVFPEDSHKNCNSFSSEDDDDSDYEAPTNVKRSKNKMEPKRTFLAKLRETRDKKEQQLKSIKKPEAPKPDRKKMPSKSSKNKGLKKIVTKKQNLKDFERSSKASTSQHKAESWYCFLCDRDAKEDMHACSVCNAFVHEDCAGLTKDDLEMFVCPRCD